MLYSEVRDEDQEPFLSNGEHNSGSDSIHKSSKRHVLLLIGILLMSTMAHATLLWQWHAAPQAVDLSMSTASQELSILYSPFHDVIKLQVEIWPEDAWDNSIYIGDPSHELDAAWDKLQAVEGISVAPEEATKLNLASNITLKSGDQAVVVGYFHNLHCIRYLYQGLHPDIYVRGNDPNHAGVGHSYHCLETLRRSVLCNPDLTLHEIYWQDERKLGMTLRPESTRQCVDFSAINDFAVTRKFPREAIVDS